MAPFRARLMTSSSRRDAIVCLPEGEFRRESKTRPQQPTPHVRRRRQASTASVEGVGAEGTLPRGRSGPAVRSAQPDPGDRVAEGAAVSRPAPGGGPIFCSPWSRNHTSPEAGSREGEQQYAVRGATRRCAGRRPAFPDPRPVRGSGEEPPAALRAAVPTGGRRSLAVPARPHYRRTKEEPRGRMAPGFKFDLRSDQAQRRRL